MKKTIFTRLLSVLLFAVILAGAFSCAGREEPVAPGSGDEGTESETVPAETRLQADLPEMTFDGYTFTIVHWDLPGMTPIYNDLYAEETDGDPIIDEVFRRNARISEALDVEFAFSYVEFHELIEDCRTCVNTSDDMYDLVFVRMHESPELMMEGDLLDFEHDFKYVDLDKPWWDQGLRRELNLADHLFIASSDISIQDNQDTYAMAFNKKIAKDNGIEDLYELVRNGEWTLEKLYSLSSETSHDNNGDGAIDPMEDLVGFLASDDTTISFFFSMGGRFTEKDEFGYPEFCYNTEESYDIVSEILDFMYDESTVRLEKGYPIHNDVCFRANRALFTNIAIYNSIAWRGEDGLDFGILPAPTKEEGDDLLALVSRHHCGLMSVLRSEENADTVGYIMEAMAAFSHYELQEAYYDITLKTKTARDDESEEMLDLIFSHRTTDIGEVCNFGNFPTEILRLASNGRQKTDLASTYARCESLIQSDIEHFAEQVDKIDEMRG